MTDETRTEQLAEIEGQGEPIQVREGRWKTRGGEVKYVKPTPPEHVLVDDFPWWDGAKLWRNDGRYVVHEHELDLLEYLGPIEPQPQAEAEAQPEPQPIQVREGRWRTRGGDIRNVTPTPEGDDRRERWPWWDAQYDQTWLANGRYHFGAESVMDLVTYLGPIEPEAQPVPEPEPAAYYPPEGWRLVPIGETLREGDEIVQSDDGRRYPTERVGSIVGANHRYIRPIEPEPEPEPQLDPAAFTPPEGWRLVETHEELDIPGRDQYVIGPNRYIRPIEPQPATESDAETIRDLKALYAAASKTLGDAGKANDELQAQVAFLKKREVTLGTRLQQEREVTTRLRSELESMQFMLGETERRTVELGALVKDLRTINEGSEKAVERANNENDRLALQWEAVKAELTIAAAVCQQLQIELDAAQQVPADSPELRQLRSDLAEMTRDRDDYRRAHELWVQDANTAHERTRAMTVEAIIEWLQPFRGCKNPALALPLLEALPDIIRSLTGLAGEEIE